MKTYKVTLKDKRHVIVHADSYKEKDGRFVFTQECEDEQFFVTDEVVGISIEPDPPMPIMA